MAGRGRVGMWGVVGLALTVPPGAAEAQSLEEGIEDAPPGDVAFQVEVREGVRVCGDGDILRNGDRWFRGSGGDRGPYDDCSDGPLRVVLVRGADGGLVDLELTRRDPDFAGTELGVVDSGQAGAFLLDRARHSGLGEGGVGHALMVSTLIRDFDPGLGLLEIARDRGALEETRKRALFWVAQEASERIGPHLVGIAADEAEDQEVRDAAVFALSRRPDDEAVPLLMELARTAPHAGTRRSALFWLARFDDPRVPDFFAEIILRGG